MITAITETRGGCNESCRSHVGGRRRGVTRVTPRSLKKEINNTHPSKSDRKSELKVSRVEHLHRGDRHRLSNIDVHVVFVTQAMAAVVAVVVAAYVSQRQNKLSMAVLDSLVTFN